MNGKSCLIPLMKQNSTASGEDSIRHVRSTSYYDTSFILSKKLLNSYFDERQT